MLFLILIYVFSHDLLAFAVSSGLSRGGVVVFGCTLLESEVRCGEEMRWEGRRDVTWEQQLRRPRGDRK